MHPMLIARSSLLAGLVLLAACAPSAPPVDAPADQQAIADLAEREMVAFASGDADALAALFTADAVAMPPNEPTVSGLAAIREWSAGLNEQFSVSGSYDMTDSHVMGDLAYQWMTFELRLTPRAGGEEVVDRGRGLHILMRQPDGSWKISLDIWNSSMPLPGM